MKLVKALLLAAVLVLSPTLALAGDVVIGDDFDDSGPVIPEPTSALLMAAGLVTIGLVCRSRRR